MEKVSVVIPVYGQWDMVKRNVEALLHFDKQNIKEVIIVNDCSPEPCPYNFDPTIIKILNNPKNLGYTGTVNNGLKNANSDIIILLDSDARSMEPFISKVIATYQLNPTVGCVGFGTVDTQGKRVGNTQFEPSLLGYIAGQQLRSKLGILKFWRNRNLLPHSCALSFRKECIEELNYFDEETFPALEADVDLNMRIHRSRWTLLFAEDIKVIHQGGISYQINYKRVLLYHYSRWKLLVKFNQIKNPMFAKRLLKARVLTEIQLLRILLYFSQNKLIIGDKMKGRNLLLKEIDHY